MIPNLSRNPKRAAASGLLAASFLLSGCEPGPALRANPSPASGKAVELAEQVPGEEPPQAFAEPFAVHDDESGSVGSLAEPEGIPLIGQDEKGQATQVFVKDKDYASRLESTLSTFHDSALVALQRRSSAGKWLLRAFSIGVGINIEVGIGPVRVGALPRLRLIFSNSTDPVRL